MDKKQLINTNIERHHVLPTPKEVQVALPATQASLETVSEGRRLICNILAGKDPRQFLVVGPCSIHDPKAALEYAHKLKELAQRVEDRFVIVMRVYFEKPRTTIGWKGLINDPHMNDSFHIETGLKLARKLLLDLTSLGLYTATEALDPVTPQYMSELICWYAIGARTIESQTHRELASGLSCVVGFKNGTDGNVQVAIDAMRSALRPHHFLGIDSEGRIAVFRTKGNSCGHVVLRGGKAPNYDLKSIRACETALEEAGLPKRVMVDCSHGNSNKDHKNQPKVFREVLEAKKKGASVIGMMIESNLYEGNQPIPRNLQDPSQLKYGVSVTDKCLGWKETEQMIISA